MINNVRWNLKSNSSSNRPNILLCKGVRISGLIQNGFLTCTKTKVSPTLQDIKLLSVGVFYWILWNLCLIPCYWLYLWLKFWSLCWCGFFPMPFPLFFSSIPLRIRGSRIWKSCRRKVIEFWSKSFWKCWDSSRSESNSSPIMTNLKLTFLRLLMTWIKSLTTLISHLMNS